MDTPPDSSNRLWLLPLLLLGVALSLLTVFWLVIGTSIDKVVVENPPPPVAKLSQADSLRLIELRNLALGHLENLEFEPADKALTEIIRLLPSDPFGPRNLAICRQLAYDSLDKRRDPSAFDHAALAAKEAVQSSIDAEPESPVPLVIASRIAIKQELTEQAISDLRKAMTLSPDAVGPAYDLFALIQANPTDTASEESFNALRTVVQKEPNNLFVIKDWLPLLVQRRSPDFLDSLKQIQETISPFVDSIKINSRVDLNDIFKKMVAAVEKGEWPVVQRNATIVKNLIISEVGRDKRFVSLDSLEYLLTDFTEEFRSRADLPSVATSDSKPVHFQAISEETDLAAGKQVRDVAVVDFDLHGRPDVLVLQEGEVLAWGRHTDSQSRGPLARLPIEGSYTGLLVCDFDDDVDQDLKAFAGDKQPADALRHEYYLQGLSHAADPDLVLYGPSGLKLVENKKEAGSDSRTLVPRSAGKAFDHLRNVVAATLADVDNDGDVDVIASESGAVRIFSNRGNLTFDDISHYSMLPPAETKVTAFAIMDWDRDTDIDIVVATETSAGWLENVRHGRLRYHQLPDFSALKGAKILKAGDFNGDLSWDLLAAGADGARTFVTHRSPAGLVTLKATSQLDASATNAAEIGDFDNDGTSDIILVSGKGATIYNGDGTGGFTAAPRAAEDWLKGTTAFAVADIDRDGDLDLVTDDSKGVQVLLSQCRESDNPQNESLEIQLVGYTVRPGEQNTDKRTNHINLGGMLEAKSGSRYQAKVVLGPLTHFGLGKGQKAELVRVLWTNGIPTNLIDPVPGEPISIEQKLHGSCPYLYTWDGERFVFATDLLWNAPLGMKFTETVIAPWREWEYIKIDGHQLKPLQNQYQLRVTAELWEAEYFDQFKLFAIDHPAGTDIFTNEKVGPPSIAEPKIHTVQQRHLPVAAHDPAGRDILHQVVSRDEVYTKTFERRLAQGLTNEHFLELDLGEFATGSNVMLYLTGWMYPGSTSLSVQHSQNPDMPKPRPPALLTVDAQGEWRESIPFMGFPGGKTKTIAVDVSKCFPTSDHRLRIVSTMEIFWDTVFFTVNDARVEYRQTELTMTRAELVDRGGVSFRWWPTSGNGPDQFDYQNLVKGEAWPAMSGNFTRFGDVLPLLTTRDDHLVVSGSGDEIQLAFAEPAEALPPGWVRDFVLYSVGWDKDADLNTVYGDTVEPLPYEAMTVYAHQDGESRPLDPPYVRYLQEYQTRKRNPQTYWKSVQHWKRPDNGIGTR